jgi:AcrR family transcriptional regulator
MGSYEGGRAGRPRSEEARTAVLHAVDDLLVEVGYAALTMKGIAERAGVGRQTVYRWWSTKAEVLFEAAVTDAERELAVAPGRTTRAELTAYVEVVTAFLTTSQAGAGYRALVGEAQHDPDVATMMSDTDLFDRAAAPLLDRAVERGDLPRRVDRAAITASLVGPVLFRLLTGGAAPAARAVADAALAAYGSR